MNKKDKYYEAKEYLNEYRTLILKKESTHYKMIDLDRKINQPQTASVIEMKQGSKETKPEGVNIIKEYIFKLEDLYIKQKEYIKQIEKKQEEINKFIKDNTSCELEYIILFLYYIDRYNLENISVKLGYTYRHIVRIYVNGLKNIQNKLVVAKKTKKS